MIEPYRHPAGGARLAGEWTRGGAGASSGGPYRPLQAACTMAGSQSWQVPTGARRSQPKWRKGGAGSAPGAVVGGDPHVAVRGSGVGKPGNSAMACPCRVPVTGEIDGAVVAAAEATAAIRGLRQARDDGSEHFPILPAPLNCRYVSNG